MAARDCMFTISFVLCMFMGVFYIVCFSTEAWVRYHLTINGHNESGVYGLWKKCATNETSKTYYCTHTHLAQGPWFLEVSRTLACFGLVFVVGSMLGYMFADHTDAQGNLFQKFKFRLQEICSMLAGILGTNSSSIHMNNSEEHYKKDLQIDDVHIGEVVIMMLVVSVIMWANSILMWSTRPCPDKCKKATTPAKPAAAPKANEAESRKKWLSTRAMPTPVEQKATMELTPTQKSHGTGQQDSTDDVEVKKGWSRSIVAPTQVILAIKRLRKGEKREEKDKPIEVAEEKTNESENEQNNKLKGIFTVAVDNKPKARSGLAPPVPPPILTTPKRRSDSFSSSSSSSSSVSIEAAHVSKNTKTGKAIKPKPQPVIRHFSQNEAEIRARAQQAAVVVTDEASLRAAQENPRPKMSKRHATHQEASLRTAVGNAASSDGNTLNIYHIPDEPVTHGIVPPPSNYEV